MNTEEQLELLDRAGHEDSFADRLKSCAAYPLRASSIDVLQVNITRRCNLRCRHCHVEGSPERTGDLSRENMEACLQAATHAEIKALDITGGAPELHPHFEWFLRKAAELGKKLLVRSNGAILLEPPYRRFLDLYAETGAEVVVSLPHPLAERTDRMRGSGIFNRVIESLLELNKRGYGLDGSGRVLDLAHNPVGAFLPGSQRALEKEYRRVLQHCYGIEFNRLYCLVNCPVGRYLEFLESSGNLAEYLNTLKQSFNPAAVSGVMCRSTLSVGVDGRLFDCDFNQVLDLDLGTGSPMRIRDFDFRKLARREVVVRTHCFACTAGAGSSCRGALDTPDGTH